MNFFSIFKRNLIFKLKKKIDIDKDTFKNNIELEELFSYYKTDKANFIKSEKTYGHGYAEFYEKHFSNLRDKKLNILEIGSYSGASAAAFVKYFKDVNIYCLDINLTKFLYKSKKIHPFGLDVSNKRMVEKFLDKINFFPNFKSKRYNRSPLKAVKSILSIHDQFCQELFSNKKINDIKRFCEDNMFESSNEDDEVYRQMYDAANTFIEFREIKRKDIEKEKNIISESSFDYIDNEIFNFLYGKAKLKLWKEFALNFRLKSKSYYVPNKIYCNESDNFDYWLSKKRILICTRELNASLLSRGIKYLKGSGIYE